MKEDDMTLMRPLMQWYGKVSKSLLSRYSFENNSSIIIYSSIIFLGCTFIIFLSTICYAISSYCPIPGELDSQIYDQTTIWNSTVTKAVDELIITDMDMDGKNDIAHITEDGSVIVFSPSLGIEIWRQTFSGTILYEFEVGNIDSDSSPEIVIASSDGLICLDYQTHSIQWQIQELCRVYSLTMFDIYSNGTDALFFLNYSILYRLDGHGEEIFNITIAPINGELGILSMQIDDIDENGNPDIIVTDKGIDLIGGGRNGHHIWIFDCLTGNARLVHTYSSGFFCSEPAIVNLEGERYLAIGLYSQTGEDDVFLYNVKTRFEQLYNVFDDPNSSVSDWIYIVSIPEEGAGSDKILMCSSNEVILTWSYGSSKPDWSNWFSSSIPMAIRAQPMVCDSDSDGRLEILIPFGTIDILDSMTGEAEDSYEVDKNPLKLDVMMSMGDIDGDKLSEICYGYFNNNDDTYRVVVIDSPSCSMSLDGSPSLPITLYPGFENQVGFLIENMTTNRLHYSMYIQSSNTVLGIFVIADISLANLSVLSPDSSRLLITHPTLYLNGTRLHVQFCLVATWQHPLEEYITLSVQVRSSAMNITSWTYDDFYRVEGNLVMTGDVQVTSLSRGALQDGSWVGPGEAMNISGFRITFEGAPDKQPAWDAFKIVVGVGSSLTYVDLSTTEVFLVELYAPDVGDPTIITLAIHRVPLNDTTPIQFSISLRVDAESPRILSSYPDDTTWICNRSLRFYIVAVDGQSGLDIARSRYLIQLNGMVEGEWKELQNASVRMKDGGLVIELDGRFVEGINRVFWNVSDRVGNAMLYVQPVQIDLTNIVFLDFQPVGWVNGSVVPCSIVALDDNGSGINGSSLQVSWSNLDAFSFSPWMDLEGYDDAEMLTLSYVLDGKEGRTNYVRFRGRDNAAQNYSVSPTFEVWIDTKAPEVIIEQPGNNVIIGPDERTIVVIAYDNSSGLEIVVPRLVVADGMAEVPVTMDIQSIENGGLQYLFIWNSSAYSFLFYLVCEDAVGNAAVYGPLAFTVNRPPSSVIVSPGEGAVFTAGDEINFTANVSDADGDILSLSWVLDNTTVISEMQSFKTKELQPGAHQIALIVNDDYYSVVMRTNITIEEKSIDNDGHFRIGGLDFLWILLSIIVIVIVIVSALFWRRKGSDSNKLE